MSQTPGVKYGATHDQSQLVEHTRDVFSQMSLAICLLVPYNKICGHLHSRRRNTLVTIPLLLH